MTAALLALVLAAAAETPVPETPVAAALRAEVARAMDSLQLEGIEKPYYISAVVTEETGLSAEAVAGCAVPVRAGRDRSLEVTVRVGSYSLDQSGFESGASRRGAGKVAANFPLDDEPMVMRRAVWLAIDRAYKQAGTVYAAKRAFLDSRGSGASLKYADFAKEDVAQARLASVPPPLDRARAEALARRLSKALGGDDAVRGRVRVLGLTQRRTFVDSEGASVDTASSWVGVEAAAWAEAADGMPVRDVYGRYVTDLDALPPAETLERAMVELSLSVREAALAEELDEPYLGPVLFEGPAAAEAVFLLLADNVSEPRQPLFGAGDQGPSSEWASRQGGRVLDRSLSLIDDPSLKLRNGVPIISSYDFDLEGVAAKPVSLVEKGILKDYVRTRRPRKGATNSNGHARSLGGSAPQLGAVAMPSTLVLSAGEGASSPEAVRARFLEEIKARDLPFGLIVRKLDDDSIEQLGATDALDQIEGQMDNSRPSALTPPVEVWKLLRDGQEERVRGVRWGAVRALALRDVLAVTPPTAPESIVNFVLVSDLDYTRDGALNANAVPVSAVAPGMLLLEEAEMQPLRGPFARLPLLGPRPEAP